VGNPEEKRPLGRPRRTWEDNIKMDVRGIRGGCVGWINLAQNKNHFSNLFSDIFSLLPLIYT
jgi:hypothetical protein